jgi:hypothetical protein
VSATILPVRITILLTLLQSCIGQRFSMIEMKSFLYILLCSFEFLQTEEQVYKANV